MLLRINVTEEDLQSNDPIKVAVLRDAGLEVTVDNRFMVVKGNEKFPRRLPLSAELFQINRNLGREVMPFTFEV